MIADQYRRQIAWRSWDAVLDALPSLHGHTVVDLGCAIGDQAALLSDRGARVIGFDANEELLSVARSRGVEGAEFRIADLRVFNSPGEPFDGLWCSFMAAYFPDLSSVLTSWTADLRPGGWVALVEVDDLFGHEPVETRTRQLLDAYADEALRTGRYDFRMGRRLARHVQDAGLNVSRSFRLPDQELAFDGPARPEVLEAWRSRFDRMSLLKDFCGSEFERVQSDFLGCLQNSAHRSLGSVRACIAMR